MEITEHFTSEEFACRDKKHTPYPSVWLKDRLKPLCEALEIIREASGGQIIIVSGYRTPEHNKAVGGSKKSQHVNGIAVDIVSRKLSALKLHNLIEKLIEEGKIPEGGLGMYHSWTHYDLRGHKARWVGQ